MCESPFAEGVNSSTSRHEVVCINAVSLARSDVSLEHLRRLPFLKITHLIFFLSFFCVPFPLPPGP